MAKVLLKAAWLPVDTGRVLMARSSNPALFYNAGGTIEPGESDVEALIREVREETSVQLVPSSIKRLNTFVDKVDGTGETLVTLAFSADYEGVLKACGEVKELGWFRVTDRHRTTPMGRQILDWLYSNGLIIV